jgi:hypothetical protein
MFEDEEMAEISDVQVLKETEKVVLCEIEGESIVIPRTLISEDSEIGNGEEYGTLIIPLWYADKNGLV